MKKATLLLAMFAVLCVFATTSTAVVVYQNDYEGGTAGAGAGGWNWGTTICTHSAVFADDGAGNIVVRHTGTVNNNTTAAADARFGSKWDITLSGNTSADPADYTVSFDIRNVSGNWNPIEEGFAVVTWAPGTTSGDDQGHGYPVTSAAQADGWVHVEFNLADWSNNWWQGVNWDLTQSRWSIEIGQPWPGLSIAPGVSFVQIWEMDNLKIIMGSDIEAHDQVVLPDNGDGTAGTLISQTQAQVTFGWNAGGDPGYLDGYRVNPAIKGHYIYLTNGNPADPNLYLLDYVAQVHNADPNLTDPYNEYGPVTVNQATAYNWQIEEAVADPNGNPFPAGNSNNIAGQVWSFTTVAATPTIVTGPAHAVADSNGNALFSVTTGPVATDVRWFKVGSPDIQLADGGIYSGTQTRTLAITGATIADEGQFYCVAYNGNPDEGGIPSAPSNSAKLWYPRLVSHYPFEVMNEGVTPDILSGFDLTMMSADTGTDLPVLDAASKVGSYGLKFNNPAADPADPENVDGQYAVAAMGAGDYLDITISAWVYSSSGGAWHRIVDFGNDTDHYIFLCTNTYGEAGRVRFAVKNGADTEQGINSEIGALPTGEWTHVAATLTGTTGRLYLNGELIATGTIERNPVDFAPMVNNYIGKSQWPDPYFNGAIDDLKIWNYAISTLDVANEYLDIAGGSVCNREIYDMQAYDTNGNCRIDLPDFASFAERWLEDQRIYAD